MRGRSRLLSWACFWQKRRQSAGFDYQASSPYPTQESVDLSSVYSRQAGAQTEGGFSLARQSGRSFDSRQPIVLCHYALRVWNRSNRGSWHLYGHSNGRLPEVPHSLSMDVGVDTHDFCPWHYDEIADIMRKKAEAPALASDH